MHTYINQHKTPHAMAWGQYSVHVYLSLCSGRYALSASQDPLGKQGQRLFELILFCLPTDGSCTAPVAGVPVSCWTGRLFFRCHMWLRCV